MANFQGIKSRGKASITVLEAIQSDGNLESFLATKAAKEQRPVYLKHIREHYEKALNEIVAAVENAPSGEKAVGASKKHGPPGEPLVIFSGRWDELTPHYRRYKERHGLSFRHKRKTGDMAAAVAAALATKSSARPIGDPVIARRGYVEASSRVKPIRRTNEYRKLVLSPVALQEPGTSHILVEMKFDLVKLPNPLDLLVRKSYSTGVPASPSLVGGKWRATDPLERVMFGEEGGAKRPRLYRPMISDIAAAWGRNLDEALKKVR